jgi:hypothetical protein
MSSEGYKVPGAKMRSRFGTSHSQMRSQGRAYMQSCAAYGEPVKPKPYLQLPKRLAKRCAHTRMVDSSRGGPESGCIELHCPTCGFSFHETLY